MNTLDLTRFSVLTMQNLKDAVAESGHPNPPVETVVLSIAGASSLAEDGNKDGKGPQYIDYFVVDKSKINVIIALPEGDA